MKRKFIENKIIGVTGYEPYDNLAIQRIIELEGGVVKGDNGYNHIWEEQQVIVIGTNDFDKEYLQRSIEAGIELNFRCQYMTQEDFWFWWLDEEEPVPYLKSDSRIDEHEGLKFLASVGFEFPTVKESLENESENLYDFGERRLEHELKSVFGYNVQKKTLVNERRKALKKAVCEKTGLGLREVAFHIFGRIGENGRNKKMENAIKNWKSDLDWLRENHYDNTIHSFRFPEHF